MRAQVLALLLALPAFAARKHKPPKRLAGDDRSLASATVSFTAPADVSELLEGPIQIQLATAKLPPNAHVHLIVDNEPAFEVDDPSRPLTLTGLDRGPHLLRAVLCLPWHEVVKAPHAFALSRFWVGQKLEGKSGKAAEFVAWPDPKKPMVTYVLPLGAPPSQLTLEGPSQSRTGEEPPEDKAAPPRTDKPVLDFYLSNAKLARRGDKLRVVLDRRELPLVTEWKPQKLRKARPGPHKITIDLLNRKGLKVKNAINRTDRSFTASNG